MIKAVSIFGMMAFLFEQLMPWSLCPVGLGCTIFTGNSHFVKLNNTANILG
jgi:hypothetical protein